MLEQALQLAELGYRIFPCAVGDKKPATKNGVLDATVDESKIEQWWTDTPRANIGLATAGLLVVDVDVIDGKPNTWLYDQLDKLLDLSAAPCVITPRGGRHYYFRAPAGRDLRNTASKIAPGVDTRANGGYVLCPPSVVGGKAYAWQGEPRLDSPASSLPLPPAWLLAMLDGSAVASTRETSSPPAAGIKEGGRNSALISLAGTMRRVGMSEDAILAALVKENIARCTPPLEAKEVETIARSGASYVPDPIASALVEGSPTALVRQADPGHFPPELLVVPGFIKEVTDWSLAGAYKRQPELALAGALSLLSVLTGRKVTDHWGTRTNLYCVGIGESGCGKERARKVNKAVLHIAGLGKMIGPEGLASSAGLISAIVCQPAILFQFDEMGRLIKTLGSATKSPHLYGIVTQLLKLFTSSDSIYKTEGYADAEKNKTIDQPHAVIFGTTVPGSLYEGLTTESLTDGFLSRLLVFESSDSDPEPQAPNQSTVPTSILECARYWGAYQTPGNLSSEHPTPTVIAYTPDAERILLDLEKSARAERSGKGSEVATLWTRTTEKARKLALLYACSADRLAPVVDEDAATWGAAVSDYLTRRLLYLAEQHIADNPFEEKRKRVLRAIRGKPDGISGSDLCFATKSIPSRERKEVLESLQESGEIRIEQRQTGGRPLSLYVAA